MRLLCAICGRELVCEGVVKGIKDRVVIEYACMSCDKVDVLLEV